MGRTVPSFRIALEQEIDTWKYYRRALGKKSREALQLVFNSARNHVSASSYAVRTSRFEGLFMGCAFAHEKQLAEIASELEKLGLKVRKSEQN